MNILALILVLDASILASMQAPDLPDDFGKSSGTTVAVEPAGSQPAPLPVVPAAVPSIRFESVAQAAPGLKTTTSKISDRWLVSESWCPSCPAAKARFKASGGDEAHIITIAQAKAMHGRTISSVPTEYTTESTVEIVQPPSYRRAKRMEVTLDKDHTPSKSEILSHLRNGGPHQGKHWQAWHLESWEKEQLYALHDDDHAGNVPTFEATPIVAAVVENAGLSGDTIAAALATHLHQNQGLPAPAFGSLFDVTIDTPDSARGWIADLLSKQSVEFPASGVVVSWKGSDRTISVAPGRIAIKPGASVSVTKFLVQLTASLDAIAYADDLSWVTLELGGVPDLTVRLK